MLGLVHLGVWAMPTVPSEGHCPAWHLMLWPILGPMWPRTSWSMQLKPKWTPEPWGFTHTLSQGTKPVGGHGNPKFMIQDSKRTGHNGPPQPHETAGPMNNKIKLIERGQWCSCAGKCKWSEEGVVEKHLEEPLHRGSLDPDSCSVLSMCSFITTPLSYDLA